MNGYEVIGNAYAKLKEKTTDQEEMKDIDSNIKVLGFLKDCNDNDVCNLFNSSAFNEISKAYTKKAMKENNVDDETIQNVLVSLGFLFNDERAQEIIK